MPEAAAPQPWHDFYWQAWESLRHDRDYGSMGGQSPVKYLAISQFARDHGITGSEFETFHTLFSVLDAEWLRHVAETRTKEAQQT